MQASGGSKFGAVEAVSMAAKKVFSFFAKKTKDIQKSDSILSPMVMMATMMKTNPKKNLKTRRR